MASELRVNTLKDANGNNSVSTSNLEISRAKAFARYHISDNSLNATLNVSGGTDNGTGDYTLSFSNAFSVANDITTGQGGVTGGNELRQPQTRTLATGSVRVSIVYVNGGVVDQDGTTNIYFGALA